MKVKVDKVGLQIKCLLELNCVCPVPLNSARAFVALGSCMVEGAKIHMPSKAATMDLMLTVVGSGTKRERVSSGVPFYDERHVTPRGCCWSVKQDHKFLTKISTCVVFSVSILLRFWGCLKLSMIFVVPCISLILSLFLSSSRFFITSVNSSWLFLL